MEDLDILLQTEYKIEKELDKNKEEREQRKTKLLELKEEINRVKEELENKKRALEVVDILIKNINNKNFFQRFINELKLAFNPEIHIDKNELGGVKSPILGAILLFPSLAIILGIMYSSLPLMQNALIFGGVSSVLSVCTFKYIQYIFRKYEATLGNIHMQLQSQIMRLSQKGQEFEKKFVDIEKEFSDLEKETERLISKAEKNIIDNGILEKIKEPDLHKALVLRYKV